MNDGDVIVTLQGSIGRVAIVKNKAFIDRTLLKFETFNQEIDHYFWAHLMKLKFLKEAKSAPGGTIKTITKEVLSDFDILLPVFREQEEIGTLLTNIENLITLHQKSAPGGTIKTITKEVLSDFDILLPVFREQEEIGTLLTNIENLITLHQCKSPGGTIKTITKEVLSDFDILLPVFREQEEIGTLLTNIENLITLHQCKSQ